MFARSRGLFYLCFSFSLFPAGGGLYDRYPSFYLPFLWEANKRRLMCGFCNAVPPPSAYLSMKYVCVIILFFYSCVFCINRFMHESCCGACFGSRSIHRFARGSFYLFVNFCLVFFAFFCAVGFSFFLVRAVAGRRLPSSRGMNEPFFFRGTCLLLQVRSLPSCTRLCAQYACNIQYIHRQGRRA